VNVLCASADLVGSLWGSALTAFPFIFLIEWLRQSERFTGPASCVVWAAADRRHDFLSWWSDTGVSHHRTAAQARQAISCLILLNETTLHRKLAVGFAAAFVKQERIFTWQTI